VTTVANHADGHDNGQSVRELFIQILTDVPSEISEFLVVLVAHL
jgi:hypothetical protein